ncbi:hypothetical protein [Neobacillus muris]|uniref:hypothetical protein n=1 Tax=Neobacillus muris TaxID=2941334 RepID=UPI00203FD526|nr:hypothetical protein [Neobacillus muris]
MERKNRPSFDFCQFEQKGLINNRGRTARWSGESSQRFAKSQFNLPFPSLDNDLVK